jgi:hypothetical protein
MGPLRLALFTTLPAVNPKPVPLILVPVKELGVPKFGVTKAGELDKTTLTDPVLEPTPVPPCATDKGVDSAPKEVMSLLAPEEAASKLALAPFAEDAPVPPSAKAKSTMPVMLPPVIATAIASCVAIVPSARLVRAVGALARSDKLFARKA